MIESILHTFDLSQKEKHIFMKVVELGSQPASAIARMVEMPRNTVRGILDALVKKGLLLKTSRAKTQYYSPENKKNIIRLLKRKKLQVTSL